MPNWYKQAFFLSLDPKFDELLRTESNKLIFVQKSEHVSTHLRRAETAKLNAAVALVQKIMKESTTIRSTRSVQMEVATKFHVNLSSLEKRMQRANNKVPKKRHGGNALTEEQERIVVGFVKAISVGTHLTMRDIATLGTTLLQYEHPYVEPLTTGWAQRLVFKHQSDLAVRTLKPSDKINNVMQVWRYLLDWNKSFSALLEKRSYRNTLVFNCDETRAIPRDTTSSGVTAVGRTEAHLLKTKSCNLWTIFTVVCAEGSVLFSAYIYRDPTWSTKSIKLDIPDLDVEPPGWPIYFFRTESGFMNSMVWMECLEIFINLTRPLQSRPDEPILLLADGASSHSKEASAMMLQPHNIDIVFFPANTSNFIQPLDGYPFAIFKVKFGSVLRQLKLSSALMDGGKMTANLPHLAYICEKDAMTPDSIRKSFRERGIVPYDFTKIITNFEAAHHEVAEGNEEFTMNLLISRLAELSINQLVRPDILSKPKVLEVKPLQRAFTPADIIACREQRLKEEEEKLRAKQEKEILKEEKRVERERLAKEKEEKKALKLLEKSQKLLTQPSQRKKQPNTVPNDELENRPNVVPMTEVTLTPGATIPDSTTQKPLSTSKSTKLTITCSECGLDLGKGIKKHRCTQCSTYVLCASCANSTFLVDHTSSTHPGARLPSARRNPNIITRT